MRRAVFIIFIVGFMVLAVVAGVPERSVAAADICDQAKSTADLLACANQRYERAQERLSAVFEDVARTEGDTLQAFRGAQRNWIAYRDEECRWEAGIKDVESLRRIDELTCLTYLTGVRIAHLEVIAQKIETAAGPGASGPGAAESVPRWMNVLAEEYPAVFWHYASRSAVDLNCDGSREHVIHGLRMGAKPEDTGFYIAVAQDPEVGRPVIQLQEISFPGEAQGACSAKVSLSAHGAGDALSDGRNCDAYMDISAKNCGVQRLRLGAKGLHVESLSD